MTPEDRADPDLIDDGNTETMLEAFLTALAMVSCVALVLGLLVAV